MATQAQRAGAGAGVDRERAFFFALAIAIVVTTVSGFALQFAMGRSTLASPWWVHLHGVTAMGWLTLYLTQNFLVFRGTMALHRQLGWIASAYLGWMVAVGFSVTTLSAITHRIPFFFEPNVFIVMDWTVDLLFAGLTWTAVAMRAQPDWHRRLMLCGAVVVMTPGVGRLLPLPLMGTWILWSIWLVMAVYVAVAMAFDVLTRGRVHPAYLWGFGAITAAIALMRPLAFSPPLLSLTKTLMG
ncbi:hypothetical protein [Sphingomonas sp. CARO-RG-8B-R24-01]|uniref:hypothetical protein n=1 Tax=Sphingomonas sp. CARO-RG-8B-R24-01 TaxID=2914831 RepID=UPI001F55AAF3|nr:hypothetical protein [Sphingomonas sp. CARO-RG-8B-R24-01]